MNGKLKRGVRERLGLPPRLYASTPAVAALAGHRLAQWIEGQIVKAHEECRKATTDREAWYWRGAAEALKDVLLKVNGEPVRSSR